MSDDAIRAYPGEVVPFNAALMPRRDLRLDPGPIPLYHQLEQELRARIHSKEFAPGACLPTEERICELYGVSRITVRRALDALIAQGLIVKKRGVGSFVAEPRHGVRSVRLVGSLDEFLASAGQLESRILALEPAPLPETAAEALRLEPGEEATRLELVTMLDGVAVGHLYIYFPKWVGGAIELEEIESGVPIVRQIERKLNLRVARAEQLIEADVAGATAGAHLGLEATDPILRVTRTYYAADGRPLEVAFVRYHPKRYRYAIDFQAGRSA